MWWCCPHRGSKSAQSCSLKCSQSACVQSFANQLQEGSTELKNAQLTQQQLPAFHLLHVHNLKYVFVQAKQPAYKTIYCIAEKFGRH